MWPPRTVSTTLTEAIEQAIGREIDKRPGALNVLTQAEMQIVQRIVVHETQNSRLPHHTS